VDDRRQPLERLLGHRFRDPALLAQALTHRSAGAPHNERLEFLGDAVLGFLMAEALFDRFPDAREGQLTRLRASLVRGESLAALARGLGLGEHLALGGGERKSGGRERDSILADALEALLGAVYVDGGLDAARALFQGLFAPQLATLSLDDVIKDPKTRLQEWLQGRRLHLPEYEVLEVQGEGHQQSFRVACRVAACGVEAEARGATRRRAEQAAAAAVLARLEGRE
jgi:ribonuclease-3